MQSREVISTETLTLLKKFSERNEHTIVALAKELGVEIHKFSRSCYPHSVYTPCKLKRLMKSRMKNNN